jgi:hypothetical protein
MTVPFTRALTLVVGVAALTLAGCSGGDDAPPPADTGAEVAQDSGSSDTSGSEVLGVEIPAGFPGDVPLPAGTLVAATQLGEGWSLLYEGVSRDDAIAIVTHFTDAGYTEVVNSVTEDNVMASLSGEGRVISVNWDGSGDSKALIYGITPEAS